MIYTASILLRKFIRDVIVIVIISSLIVSYYVFYTKIHPSNVSDDRDPSHFQLDYENVIFSSTDDLSLKGWFISAQNKSREDPRPVIILAHGLNLSKAQAMDWGYYLSDHYNLFIFDFRAHGASEGKLTTYGGSETKDMLGAIEYLKTRKDVDLDNIGILGYDLGANTGIMTAQITADIKAIVADSAFASLSDELSEHYDQYWIMQKPLAWLTSLCFQLFARTNPKNVAPVESVKFTTAPILLIAPENDNKNSAVKANQIYENALSEKSEIWTLAGSHLDVFAGHREEYKEKVRAFFDKAL